MIRRVISVAAIVTWIASETSVHEHVGGYGHAEGAMSGNLWTCRFDYEKRICVRILSWPIKHLG